ncbi:hypothetical protein Tco_0088091 [Tanacetum coccineum]
MVVQNQSQLGEGSAIPTDPHHTPTFIQPSTQPQKTQQPRKPKRKDTQVPQPSDPIENVADEAVHKELGDSLVRAATTASSLEAEQDNGNINKTQSKATPNESSSPGTSLEVKTTQQNEIASLKRRVKKLEQKKRSRTHRLKRLHKVGMSRRVESSGDEDSLVDEESDFARRKDEANVNLIKEWDDIQAKIEGDHELARRLQAEEQERFAEEKRNKPPTQAQQRKIMCTYLKNMKGKKPKYLKNKSFDSIQKMFNRAFNRVNTFVDFRTDLVEGSLKRAGEELEQEITKKQKVDEDKDTAELQSLMEVIPNEEEVAIDVVPLATKPPTIVDWKIHKEGNKSYYQIVRADGKSQMYRVFSLMLKSFSREDLKDLYKLKMKFGSCNKEKRYPFTPPTITDMLNKKLQVDYFSEMGRIVGIKSLLNDVSITAALIDVNAAQSKDHLLKHMGALEVIFDSGCLGTLTSKRWHLKIIKNCPKVGSVTFGRKYKVVSVEKKQLILLAIPSTGAPRKFDEKSDEGFLVGYSVNSKAFRVYNLVTKRVEVNLHVNFLEEKPNVQGIGHRWMFDLDYLTDSMNYIPVSVQNQANPAGSKEVIDIDVQTEEAAELMVITSTSLTEATRKAADLSNLPTEPTSTNPVNTGSINLNTAFEKVNTGNTEAISPSADHEEEVFSDADDDEMPEIRIYDKSSEGIFEKASYDDEGIISDFNNLPDEVDVPTNPTLRIHNAHPQSQILWRSQYTCSD